MLGQTLGGASSTVSGAVGEIAEILGSVRLVPILLLAVYCMRAALLPTTVAIWWVVGLITPILAWLAYVAEHSARMALSQRRWTAASLSAGLAWAASVVVVIVVGELTLLVLPRRGRPKVSSKVRGANGDRRS